MSKLKTRFTAGKKDLPSRLERRFQTQWGEGVLLAMKPHNDPSINSYFVGQVVNLINEAAAEAVMCANDLNHWDLPMDETARRAKWTALAPLEDYLTVGETVRVVVGLLPHLQIREVHRREGEPAFEMEAADTGKFLGLYEASAFLDEVR